ncbi:MAG: hypothetical protein QOH43_1845 [Solirubrobacteraceae bacterium]|nr:hypothetical protein [Solirubrobacteraceae bacterium]
MAYKSHVLVVANLTAASDELLGAMAARAQRTPARFTMIVPVTGTNTAVRATARGRLDEALEGARAAGLEADGALGDCDPVVAVTEAFDPRHHDEIMVSTLPTGASHWMRADLPQRIGRITGAPVVHVISRDLPVAAPRASAGLR